MSAVPAAFYLADFGDDPVAVAGHDALHEAALAATAAAAAEDQLAQQVSEAHARGMEEGRAEALAEAEARIEDQKMAFEAEQAAAREAWVREEGQLLAAGIESALRGIEERISAATARVLMPFVEQAVRERAMSELRATLQDLIAGNPAVTLEVSGPEDLLQEVRGALSTSVATISYAANGACDVQVKGGGTVVETRIAEWLKQLEGAGA